MTWARIVSACIWIAVVIAGLLGAYASLALVAYVNYDDIRGPLLGRRALLAIGVGGLLLVILAASVTAFRLYPRTRR